MRLANSRKLTLYSYRKALGACLTENGIAESAEALLDWRHFYVEEGVGKSTCGVARKVAAGFLPQVSAGSTFLTPKWYNSLRLTRSNPSVLGFFTEQMLLSWISQVGCPNVGPSFARPPRVVVFSGKVPQISGDVGFSLYIALLSISGQYCRFNYGVDQRRQDRGDCGWRANHAVHKPF